MTENKNITINISTGTVLKIVGIFLIMAFIYIVRDILLTVFVAIILASLIEPIVNKLEEKKVPRPLGVVIIYIILILVLVLIARLLIPPIIEQIGLLTNNFPDFWNQVIQNFESFRQFSEDKGFLDNIQQGLQGLQASLTQAATGAYGIIISIFRNVFIFIITLVVTFYLVVQRNALSKVLKAVAPGKYHSYLDDLSVKIQGKIGAWARGQLMLGSIIAGMAFIGLLFLLPKYALVLAIVAGLTELIPYLGPTLGAIPAVFLGFTVGGFSLWRGLSVLVFFIIMQWLENNLLVPRVMKKQVGLNPVVTIIAILIGARLMGIIGVILAVPVAVSIGIVVRDFIKKSDFSREVQDVDN